MRAIKIFAVLFMAAVILAVPLGWGFITTQPMGEWVESYKASQVDTPRMGWTHHAWVAGLQPRPVHRLATLLALAACAAGAFTALTVTAVDHVNSKRQLTS